MDGFPIHEAIAVIQLELRAGLGLEEAPEGVGAQEA